jgi:hypothetical protein
VQILHLFQEELTGRNMILGLCLSPDKDDFDRIMFQLEKAKEAAKIR